MSVPFNDNEDVRPQLKDRFLSFSCCFLDVIPYGILSHALVAFSMQAKNAEVVINCVTRVYNFLLSQHGKVLQNAVLDLFKVRLTLDIIYSNFMLRVLGNLTWVSFVSKALPYWDRFSTTKANI